MKDVLYSLGVVIGQAFIFRSNDPYRGVAQLGRALGSGANHRRGAPEGKRALCANGKITKVLANTEQNP